MRKFWKRFLIVVAALLVLVLVVPFLVPVRELEGLRPPQVLAGPDSQFVTIPFGGTDGIEVHYTKTGSEEPTFLLLHGFSSNVYTWDKVVDFFAARGTAVAYDRIPFGLSERLVDGDWNGENPYTPEATLSQLFSFMDALNIEKAVLVGNSAGGQLAARAALAHPERVEALILVDAAIYTGGAPAFIAPLTNLPQLRHLGPLVARAFANSDALLEQAYHDVDNLTPESMARAKINIEVEQWDAAFWEFTAVSSGQPDISNELGQIAVPTLVITGDDDRIVPTEESIRLAGVIPEAELAVLPACGHVPQDECPQAFMDAVDAWWGGVNK